jgi:hypothetical protein
MHMPVIREYPVITPYHGTGFPEGRPRDYPVIFLVFLAKKWYFWPIFALFPDLDRYSTEV